MSKPRARRAEAVVEAYRGQSEPVGDKWQEAIADIVPKLEDLFTPGGADMPAEYVYLALERCGLVTRIYPLIRFYEKEHPATILPPDDQWEAQKRDLYERAMDGDIQAKKLWFEVHGEAMTEQDFNITVKIVPFRILDPTVRGIVREAEPHIVKDALGGLKDRLAMDEAPHELQNELIAFIKDWDDWATVNYRPKDA